MRASMIGTPQPLYPGEIPLAGAINVKTTAVARTWEYWSMRLKAAGFWPPRLSKKKASRRGKPKARPGQGGEAAVKSSGSSVRARAIHLSKPEIGVAGLLRFPQMTS